MGARARGLAAVRRRGGVRVRDLPRGLVERLRAGRPGHHPAEPASGLAIRALARLPRAIRSEEHTSELQSQSNLVCRLLLEKKKKQTESTTRSTHTANHAREPEPSGVT